MSLWAIQLGLIDHPNARSSHCTPTPKGGGIGIFAAFLLASLYSGLSTTIWLPLSILFILALVGDWIDLSPYLRLIAQLFLTIFIIIKTENLPSYPPFYLIFLLWWTVYIVGTANFYNFMDGINGMAGITGVIGFALLAKYVDMANGQKLLSTIAISISFACLGFLPFNIPKAKVFISDIGSILLGGVFGCLVYLASATFLDFVCMASFLLPFYADELTTMVIRLKDGEKLTQPHRRHIYQLLANEKGIPHWQISLGYGFFQFVVGLSILFLKPYGIIAVLLTLGFYFAIFLLSGNYLQTSLRDIIKY